MYSYDLVRINNNFIYMHKYVFSFQGAFGPPTYGHYVSMREFTKRVLHDYSASAEEIIMLFMPTSQSSSKKHLISTQEDRYLILTQKLMPKTN